MGANLSARPGSGMRNRASRLIGLNEREREKEPPSCLVDLPAPLLARAKHSQQSPVDLDSN